MCDQFFSNLKQIPTFTVQTCMDGVFNLSFTFVCIRIVSEMHLLSFRNLEPMEAYTSTEIMFIQIA